MSPERAVGVSDETSGAGVAEYRVRERTVDAATVAEQYVIFVREFVPSFIGMASSFVQSGVQPMSAIYNNTGSAILVAVRGCWVTGQSSAVNSSDRQYFVFHQTSLPGGGTALTKVSVGTGLDVAESSNASAVVLSGAATEYATTTTMTAPTLGARLFWPPANRMQSVAQQQGHAFSEQVSGLMAEGENLIDEPVVLRAGQSIYVRHGNASSTSAQKHSVTWLWNEYTNL